MPVGAQALRNVCVGVGSIPCTCSFDESKGLTTWEVMRESCLPDLKQRRGQFRALEGC